jgi:hypothetical protein
MKCPYIIFDKLIKLDMMSKKNNNASDFSCSKIYIFFFSVVDENVCRTVDNDVCDVSNVRVCDQVPEEQCLAKVRPSIKLQCKEFAEIALDNKKL